MHLANRLPAAGYQVLTHASGRPWLLSTAPLVAHQLGSRRIALLGWSAATSADLARVAERGHDIAALDQLAYDTAGSYHLVASFDGTVRVQGSGSGLRRVYYTTIDGVPVASDRADLLAQLGSLTWDTTAIALRTLRALPHPLAEVPLWHGLEPVAPECYLRLGPTGAPRQTHWWQPPDPRLSRAEGAQALRAALAEAVALRVPRDSTVHCDLSGGLDSTPVCYLASRRPATVLAATAYNDDPGVGEDLAWARKALPSMPAVRHEVLSLDDMPGFFAGVPELSTRFDEPSAALLAAPRVSYRIAHAAGRGARMYLTGLGGDHLLRGLPVWEHTLFRRRPLLAWKRLRASQMLAGMSTRDTIRGLLDNRSYRDWFGGLLADTTRSHMLTGTPSLAWDIPLSWPKWLTEDAQQAALRRLRSLAGQVSALGANRAAHSELAKIRDGVRIVRGLQQLAGEAGMPFEAPFFDDRVVAACLSVRRAERVHPLEYKPLVKEAMRGRLPEEFLRRTNKTGGGTQAARGLSRHFAELVEYCAAGPLGQLGVVDGKSLRDNAIVGQGATRDRHFDATVNCAAFLTGQRAAAGAATPAHVGGQLC